MIMNMIMIQATPNMARKGLGWAHHAWNMLELIQTISRQSDWAEPSF